MFTKLTQEQIAHFKQRMVRKGTPVRFMLEGRSYQPTTGEFTEKGTNVMHQYVYWNFDKETAKEIAKLTGTKAVFSED